MAKKEVKTIMPDVADISNNDLFVRLAVEDVGSECYLIVPETHWAIILKDGVNTGVVDAGRYPLTEGGRKAQRNSSIEVVYVSRTARLSAQWGTPELVTVSDPETGIPVRIGAGGEFEVKVKNPSKFYVVMVGMDKSFTVQDAKKRLLSRILHEIEPALGSAIRRLGVSVCRLDENKKSLDADIKAALDPIFGDYGLELTTFMVSRIVLSEEYRRAVEDEMRRKASAQEKVLCPSCGAECPAEAKFCGKCGAGLSATVICSQCGSTNPADNLFCYECGAKLR